jgi:proton-dependent oligopeptide transporter, POT family
VSTRKLNAILCTNFFTCHSLYLISPLLPIYFVESLEHGGLDWSKAEAFSVFGTFLSLLYITPLLGGLIRDRWLGREKTELLGYFGLLAGMIVLAVSSDSSLILGALICLALGSGFVKVSLAAMLGRLPERMRHKGYDLYYNTSCVGFVSGALIAPFIFERFFMSGVALCAIFGGACSLICHILFLRKGWKKDQREAPLEVGPEPTEVSPRLFFGLALAGLIFFACFNQLLTSIPVYVHQSLNRSFGNFSVPALWFGAFGSLLVTGLSPILRKCWTKAPLLNEQLYVLKFSFGCLAASLAFGFLVAFVRWGYDSSVAFSIGAVALVHVLCYIADFHIRPTLMALATHCMAVRHHALATGFVFACIGLGGKTAGFLASQIDTIGFEGVFGICLAVCLLLSIGFFLVYRYLSSCMPYALNCLAADFVEE